MRSSRILVAAMGLLLVCLAFPHREPGDSIRAGKYSFVMGKGPVPSFMELRVRAAASDWDVTGIYRNQRISLDIKANLVNKTGVLAGKATPSNGYSGQGCKVDGLWGHDRLTVKLGSPYNRQMECRYQPAKTE